MFTLSFVYSDAFILLLTFRDSLSVLSVSLSVSVTVIFRRLIRGYDIVIVIVTVVLTYARDQRHRLAAMKVLILGDSHITWLDRFVRATRPGRTDGFAVDGHNCVVRCVGRPGATLLHLRSCAVRRRVDAEAAHVVILHVGGNDLDSLPSHQPQAIGMSVFMFAKQLVGQGVRHVVISQVVRRARWRHSTVEDGTRRVDAMNEFLDAACSGPEPISFWRHKGLWNVQRTVFRLDGVHMNDLGNYRLYRSMRGAIFTAMKAIQ